MLGRQLLPQRQIFQDQFPVAAERQRECADGHDEQLQHAAHRVWSWREIQPGRVLASGRLQLASWSGLLKTVLYIVLSVFPIIKVESVSTFPFKIVMLIAVMNLVGAGILISARRR